MDNKKKFPNTGPLLPISAALPLTIKDRLRHKYLTLNSAEGLVVELVQEV